MKTRIVQTSRGFILQTFIPKFPWGGKWVGLRRSILENFYFIESVDKQIVECTFVKKSDAELLLREYIAYVEDKRKLKG